MADGGSVVVDASLLVNVLLGTRSSAGARERLVGAQMHAPAHLDLEVLSALTRLHRAREVTTARVTAALASLRNAPITRHPLTELVDEAWKRREAARVSDGLYIALCERLGAPLVTADQRLARVYRSSEAF